MKLNKSLFAGAIALAIAGIGSVSQAAVASYSGSGTSAGLPVSATADITTEAGKITIVLTNTTAFTHDACQLNTGINFTLSDVDTGTLTSKTAITRSVDSVGVYTDSGSAADLSWSLIDTGTNTFNLNFNPDAKNAIIGVPEADNTYVSANGSIKSNNGHDPYAAVSATFVIEDASITDATTVDSLTFLFCTDFDTEITGDCPDCGGDIPEPASLGVLGLGAVGLLLRRRK